MSPNRDSSGRLRIQQVLRSLGAVAALAAVSQTGANAQPTSVTLLTDYSVSVEYTDGHGTANGIDLRIISLPGDDTAGFAFRDPRDAEVLVRLLDGCSVNGHLWFLATSLTDTNYTIRLVETSSGAERTYTNPAGSRSRFADTTSFPCPPRGAEASAGVDLAAGAGPVNDRGLEPLPPRGFFCVPDSDTACLFGTNFPVEVSFSSALGSGDAFAHSPNPSQRTALFGLASSDVPDVAVKMIDSCSHYEVHWAQLGNVTLDIEVTSFLSGLTWNSPSTIDNGVDREAFVIDSDCIFTGSFEMGTRYQWSASTP